MLKQKSIDYIKKVSINYAESIKDSYNRFLIDYYKLPEDLQNREDIEDWFHKTCTDVDPYLKDLEKELKFLKFNVPKNTFSELELLQTFHSIVLLQGKIETIIYIGNREINYLI